MKKFFVLTIALVSLTSAHAVHAFSFYEHLKVQYRSPTPYTYPQPVYQQRRNDNCLYRNTHGECMIEQFMNAPTTKNTYYAPPPTYTRNYLRNERRYNGRDDDDDDRYRYNDDDDFYNDDDDDDNWEDIKDDFFGDDDDDSDDDD